jgi:tRNA (adenine37-N6)-methyltransferase
MDTITFTPIGSIHTPFETPKGTPIQPRGGKGVRGTVVVQADYAEGLVDLDGFSHLILIYAFHRVQSFKLTVKPFLDPQPHGLFATRAPARPNPIGFSVVKLLKIEGTTLHIEDVDIVDGTPLLDIKPYVPAFDERSGAKVGWLQSQLDDLPDAKDDGRFLE